MTRGGGGKLGEQEARAPDACGGEGAGGQDAAEGWRCALSYSGAQHQAEEFPIAAHRSFNQDRDFQAADQMEGVLSQPLSPGFCRPHHAGPG